MNQFTQQKMMSRVSTQPQTSHPSNHNTAINSMGNTIDNSYSNTAYITGGFIITSPDAHNTLNTQKAKRCQSAHSKMKILKQHLNSLKNTYNVHLKNRASLSTSVSKINKGITDTRRGFLKLYEKKKHRIQFSQLQKRRESELQSKKKQVKNKTKQRKLFLQLQSMVVREQLENSRAELRNKNQRDKQIFKNQCSDIASSDLYHKKISYLTSKQEKQRIKQKINYRSQYMKNKGRDKYWDKIQGEMKIIQHYQGIIKNIEGWAPQYQIDHEDSGIFVTTAQRIKTKKIPSQH